MTGEKKVIDCKAVPSGDDSVKLPTVPGSTQKIKAIRQERPSQVSFIALCSM